jgi:hypothetical protein
MRSCLLTSSAFISACTAPSATNSAFVATTARKFSLSLAKQAASVLPRSPRLVSPELSPASPAMAGRARHHTFRLAVVLLLGLAALIPATSRAQQPSAEAANVTVGLIIDADSPVGRIARTTIPMALDDFYAAFPNASARVRVVQHDSGGDVVAAASAGMDTPPPSLLRPSRAVPDDGSSRACPQRCS